MIVEQPEVVHRTEIAELRERAPFDHGGLEVTVLVGLEAGLEISARRQRQRAEEDGAAESAAMLDRM